MKTTKNYELSGPYAHENLAVYLVHGADAVDTSGYVTLEEALDSKQVVVHETGNVGQLLVENLLADKDLFILAGEVVKGGRQDRTLGVDFVVPAKSKVPVPSFCVESGRWHRRAGESAACFSSSKHYMSSKALKVATRMSRSQHEVWEKVAEAQEKLGSKLKEEVSSPSSPSSYELTLDHAKVRERRAAYVAALAGAVDARPDTVGFVFAVNGELNSAEVYASAGLFRKYWKKLLESAAVEAVAEQPETPVTVTNPGLGVVAEFLKATGGAAGREQKVTERVTLWTRQSGKDVLFETHDTAKPGAAVHSNYLHAV